MGGLNSVPTWQLTPQQQLQKKLLEQMQIAASTPMIDNRHMIVEDNDNYLKSDDESMDSDLSSDLTNSEEGFDW